MQVINIDNQYDDQQGQDDWDYEQTEPDERQQFKLHKPKVEDQISSDENEMNDEDEDWDDSQVGNRRKTRDLRKNVFSEVYGKFNKQKTFKLKIVPKPENQIQRIKRRLQQTFMFSNLDKSDQKMIIDAMEEKKFKAGETVINQGDDGQELYVVDQGQLECFKKNQSNQNGQNIFLKIYKAGEIFGELALLYNAPRAATIVSKTDSTLFALDRYTFINIVKQASIKKRELYEQFLSQVDILKHLDPYQISKITDAVIQLKFKKGNYVINEGEDGDMFYMVKEGELDAIIQSDSEQVNNQVIKKYKSGMYFGELALIKNQPRQASIICRTDCVLLGLDRYSFKRVIGEIDESIIEKNYGKKLISGKTIIQKQRSYVQQQQQSQGEDNTTEQNRSQLKPDLQDDDEVLRQYGSRQHIFNKKKDIKVTKAQTYVNHQQLSVDNQREQTQVTSQRNIQIQQKSQVSQASLKQIISFIPIFSELSTTQIDYIVGQMSQEKYEAGQVVIKQGQKNTDFYIVEYGELRCFKKFANQEKEQELKSYHKYDYFGELSILNDCATAATIQTKTSVTLVKVERNAFKEVLKDIIKQKRLKYVGQLSNMDLLSGYDTYTIQQLSDAAQSLFFKRGQYVITQGQKGDKFYMVEKGELAALVIKVPGQAPEEVKKYGPGSYFGELALITDGIRKASVVCRTDCTLISIDRHSFQLIVDSIDTDFDTSQLQKNQRKKNKTYTMKLLF